MSARSGKRTWLIYLLGFYILLQFCWWAYMLVDLNHQLYLAGTDRLTELEIPGPEILIQKSELDQALYRKIWMVLGEGAVFIIILLIGFQRVRKTIFREFELARRQNNFLLSVTHELKSPIAAIQLQLQTLRSRKVDQKTVEQILDASLKETARLKNQVEDLLQVARLETGRNSLNQETVNISELATEMLELQFKDKVDSGRIQLSISEKSLVKADKEAVSSVLANLIENALKYSDDETKVVVKVGLESDQATFSVSDNGHGIPESEKEKIFERFYRSGNENTRGTKGTGLGLYIVAQLIEAMGGKITVTDNKPSGTTFSVSLESSFS